VAAIIFAATKAVVFFVKADPRAIWITSMAAGGLCVGGAAIAEHSAKKAIKNRRSSRTYENIQGFFVIVAGLMLIASCVEGFRLNFP
jgi:hypothetical protein